MASTRTDRRSTIQSRAQALAGPCAATGVRAALAAAGNDSGSDTDVKVAELWLYGVVGGFWFGFDSKSVASELKRMGDVDEIVVRLDSPGGSAFQGIAIANLLANHPARVTIVVDGLAASAASMIALGGEELVMSPGSQLMLHDAWMFTIGNAAELRSDADWLDKQSQNYAETYAHRAGKTAAHWREVMLADDGRGTWYTAQEAVDAGLADRVANIASTTAPPPDPAQDSDLDDDDEMAARAAFDLELVHPAARAAWRERSPQPPTASADGTTHTEGGSAVAFSDEQLTTMRAKLGLPETADEAAITAAVEAVVEESLEERPPADPTGAQLPEGVVAIDASVLADLQAKATQGVEARAEQGRQARDTAIEAAIQAGKTTPARRDHWATAWDADPKGTKEVLDSLPAGLVPTTAIGDDSDPTGTTKTQEDQDYEALYPSAEQKGA